LGVNGGGRRWIRIDRCGACRTDRVSSPPYSSCKEAIADGAAPLFKGDPGYSEKLDTNGDGMACLEGSGAHYFPPKN